MVRLHEDMMNTVFVAVNSHAYIYAMAIDVFMSEDIAHFILAIKKLPICYKNVLP